MKTNLSRSGKNRQGAILTAVVIVMLVVTIMIAGLWQLCSMDGIETAQNVTSTKAFWYAEAGLHYAMALLNYDASFRASPHSISTNGTGCVYSVSVVADTTTNFTITSTGTVGRSTRIVQQTTVVVTNWPDAFDYALAGFGGTMSIKNNDIITGNVYQVGSVDIGNSTVSGTVYSTDSGVLPNPPPSPPNPDFSWYYGEISKTATLGGPMPSGNLVSGPTIYVTNSNATITQTIQGPRTLVFANNVTISGLIGPSVWILAGGTITLNSDVGDLNLMFATTGIDLGDTHTFGNQNCLLTHGDIIWKQKIVFYGIMYADGKIDYTNGRGDMSLFGSAVSGGGFDFKNLGWLQYDPSQFPALPPGFTGVPVVIRVQWKEL